VIAEREPAAFMAAFRAAAAGGGPVFLADPGWGGREQARLAEFTHSSGTDGDEGRGWLMIASGGTSGELKFARHDQDTIAAAVEGFGRHFDLSRVNAVGLLPLYHVSGFMAWMRCALTGGGYLPADWTELSAGRRPVLPAGDWVVSLVPTQLQRLLAVPAAVEWLRGFRVIFVGGGPAWPALLEAAAAARLPLALSYGMTETAAMVTALRPEEFIAGARSCGTALPHAEVRINAEGLVEVGGDSVFRGYWPHWREVRRVVTEDLGRFDEHQQLHVLGRRDAMIITGGKKVQPAQVEAALLASGEFADVAVFGLPDPEWGQAVVACYPAGRVPDLTRAGAELAPHERPKRFVPLAVWPRNAQGKLNRAAIAAQLGAGG
jgi:o-succinylbenzoate---CoA ligase